MRCSKMYKSSAIASCTIARSPSGIGRRIINAGSLSVLLFATLSPRLAFGQKQELGLTLGGFTSSDRTSTNGIPFNVGSGITLQANYEYRVLQAGPTALYVGADFLASPQRQVASANANVTRDIASLYLTPNVMLKLFPHGRINPWGTIGGGYGDYETEHHSSKRRAKRSAS